MIKKLLIGLLAIVALCVIAIGILLWNINPVLEKMRPEIVKSISEVVKQPVELGEIKASFYPNVSVKVADLSIKHLGRSVASLSSLNLVTALSDLIAGKLSVSEISLNGLKAEIVREKDGRILLGALELVSKKPSTKSEDPSSSPSVKAGNTPSSSENPLSFQISKIAVLDSSLNYIDKLPLTETEMSLDSVSMLVKDIAVGRMSPVNFSAAIMGSKSSNFAVTGEIALLDKSDLPNANLDIAISKVDTKELLKLTAAYGTDLSKNGLQLSENIGLTARIKIADNKISTSSSLIADELNFSYADLFQKKQGVPLSLKIVADPNIDGSAEINEISLALRDISINSKARVKNSNDIDIEISNFVLPLKTVGEVSPIAQIYKPSGALNGLLHLSLNPGLSGLQGDINITDFGMVLPGGEGTRMLSGLSGKLQLSTKDNLLELAPSTIGVFGGNLTISGNFSLSDNATVSTDVIAKGLDLQSVSKFAVNNYFLTATGRLENLSTKSNFNTKNIPTTLNSSVNLLALNGSIEGLNVLQKTFEKINNVPGLSAALEKYVPEKYRILLAQKGTSFDRLSTEANVANQKITLHSLELTHQHYAISGSGNALFDGELDLNVQLKLSSEFAADMIAREPKLKFLTDPKGSITIPIKIRGQGAKLLVLPDVSTLLKNAAQAGVKDLATKAIEKGIEKGLGNTFNSLFR